MLAIVVGVLRAAQADTEIVRISWADLPARVAGRLIAIEALGVTDCPDGLDQYEPVRGIIQYIENTLYRWQEHEIAGTPAPAVCIVMQEPEHRALSAEEAQVLLSASELWRESDAVWTQAAIADDGLIADAAARDEFVGSEDLDSAVFQEGGAAGAGAGDAAVDREPRAQVLDWQPWSSQVENGHGEGGAHSASLAAQCCGTEDRERVSDTTASPWNTVALLMTRFGDQAYRGTAFLAAPHVMLTSAHNVYDCERDEFAQAARVVPGQYQDDRSVVEPYEYRDAVRLETSESYCREEPRWEHDYAAVFFDQPFAQIATYLPLQFGAAPDRVEIAGYPIEVDGERSFDMWRTDGEVLSITDRLITFDTDVSPGNSGSPLWAFRGDTTRRRVVGIAGFTCPDYNGGQRLVSQNQEVIERWMRWDPSAGRDTCPADCDHSGDVSINELVLGVNIALDWLPLSECPASDPNQSDEVKINELVAAVNAALSGCP